MVALVADHPVRQLDAAPLRQGKRALAAGAGALEALHHVLARPLPHRQVDPRGEGQERMIYILPRKDIVED